MERVGDWMQTATGRMFWPLDPRADEVHLDDIAHALANQCRFAGHCKSFYSVAQHSILVSACVPPADALWGLLHDASEAYLVDLPRPVKRSPGVGPAYKVAEAAVTRAICQRFGLGETEPESVKEADSRVLLAEARDLMETPPMTWRETGLTPWPPPSIEAWPPGVGRVRFVERFFELTAKVSP